MQPKPLLTVEETLRHRASVSGHAAADKWRMKSEVALPCIPPVACGENQTGASTFLFGVLTLVLIVAVAIYSRSQDVKPGPHWPSW